MPFITSNAVLWPRSVALFANSERLAALDEDARGWIQQAADDATAWSLVHAGDREQDEMKRACTFGAKIVTASDAELTALRKAAEPVYARLSADVQQAGTLERVQSLVNGTAEPEPLAIPSGCAYRTGDEKRLPPSDEPLSGPGSAGDLPQGVYRFELDRQRLLDAGYDEHDVDLNAGVWTYTFEPGRWSYKVDSADGHTWATTCEGWYTVRNDGAAFTTVTTVEGRRLRTADLVRPLELPEGNADLERRERQGLQPGVRGGVAKDRLTERDPETFPRERPRVTF